MSGIWKNYQYQFQYQHMIFSFQRLKTIRLIVSPNVSFESPSLECVYSYRKTFFYLVSEIKIFGVQSQLYMPRFTRRK